MADSDFDFDDFDDDDGDLVPYAAFRAAESAQGGGYGSPTGRRRRRRRRPRPLPTNLAFIANDNDDLHESLGLAKPHRSDRAYADGAHAARMAQPKRVRKRTALRKGFATGKTALEWQLYHAQGLPGPGHYRPNDTRGAATGGHFSEHYNPSALERLCRMKGELPSPMSYDVHAPRSARGIKFTSGGGKTELDIIMQEMAGRPGPGHYGDTGAAYKCEGSQKFAMASRDPPTLSDKRPTPGPTDYDPPPSLSERGVALQGRGRSYLEDLNRSRRDNPGPGHYDIDAAEKHTRAGAGCRLLGRPKFYLEELYYTRRDNPGPGAYGIVEAAPPSQVACRFGSGALEEDDEVSIGSILSDGGVTRKTLETLRAKAERRPVRLVAGELTLSVDNVASTLTLDTLSPSGGGGGGGGGPAATATTLAVAAAGGGGGKVAWAKPPSPIKMEPIAV